MNKLTQSLFLIGLTLLIVGCVSSEDEQSQSLGWELIPKAITVYTGSGQTADCITNKTAFSGKGLSYIDSSKEFSSAVSKNQSCVDLDSDNPDRTATYEYTNDYYHQTKKIFINSALDGCEITKVTALNRVNKETTAYDAVGNSCGDKALWKFSRDLDGNGNTIKFSYASQDRATEVETTKSYKTEIDIYTSQLTIEFSVEHVGIDVNEQFHLVNQLPLNFSQLDKGKYALVTQLDSAGRPTAGALKKGDKIELCYGKKSKQMRAYQPNSGEGCESSFGKNIETIVDY